MSEPVPGSLLAALRDLAGWLDSSRVPAMIIGGVAVSVLGRARLTEDVDALALLPESDWATVLAGAGAFGILARVDDALDFARRSRMLLLMHSASGIHIDVSLGGLSFEVEAIGHSRIHVVGGVSLRLPRVEDLLVMKAFAHRPKDMQDIEGLLDVHPEADLELVRKWLREFAAALTMPDLLQDFEAAVARHRVDRK